MTVHPPISTVLALARVAEDGRRLLGAAEPAPRPPGIVTHVVVFCVAAYATFPGYTLLF